MPQVQYSPQRLSYVYYAAGSINVDVGDYGAANMNKLDDRTQSCRTTSLAGPRIAIDFGADVAVAAFSIEGLNTNSFTLQAATAAAPVTLIAAGSFTPLLDTEDRRRKLVCVPTITWNHRYAFLLPSGGLINPTDTLYEIQNFAAWPVLTSLNTNPEVPYKKTHFDKAETIDLGSSGDEVGPSPPIRLVIAATTKFDRDLLPDMDQYLEIAAIPRNRTWLWYEHQGDLRKMYHVQRADSMEVTRGWGTWEVGNIMLREVA